ncbi:ferritin-like domain-containing protein [Arcobacter porcinus]|uniref:Ribonucleotide-diphosphate reductase subunit beta n=1 Tax=Arcobacter porcinus TaxID=1935204 RepID=A0ABX2YAW8_9BACT|nr:ferritin-like domain-containing protein [Arcobacter porcinus]OCL81935.1 ribonucleotide-diphosphate reductase subunit beta [Arcobacter porcinus]OCL82011.1 ribonucleotide-diphosphate reductase subunit beta [Arcobacter porcinus]OCL90357.1 ribonucleotide-diphosphate reductase subunit beta [Arcobacter porcinus]
MNNQNHCISIFTGHLPPSKALFLRLENAFLICNTYEIIEIISFKEFIETELRAWAKLKGHLYLGREKLKNQFSYKIQKIVKNSYLQKASWGKKMQGIESSNPKLKDLDLSDEILKKAPDNNGLLTRGIITQENSPIYDFELSYKEQVWSNPISILYEEGKNLQWNATTDIAWNEIPNLNPILEKAICQIMTYLVENEFSALYIPAKFVSKINPYYMEVPLFLSSLMNDEARHIEVFTKRANANGGGFQYSSEVTQKSLFSLFKEDDYIKSSFLLHVMGEGTFVDLLSFLEKYMPDEATKKIIKLAKRDEMRHVAYGIEHVKSAIEQNPNRINALKNTAFKRKEFMDEVNGESSLLIESLAILAGGSDEPNDYIKGFDLVEELKQKMNENRVKRLINIGMDEDLANDISKVHTPNFM